MSESSNRQSTRYTVLPSSVSRRGAGGLRITFGGNPTGLRTLSLGMGAILLLLITGSPRLRLRLAILITGSPRLRLRLAILITGSPRLRLRLAILITGSPRLRLRLAIPYAGR